MRYRNRRAHCGLENRNSPSGNFVSLEERLPEPHENEGLRIKNWQQIWACGLLPDNWQQLFFGQR